MIYLQWDPVAMRCDWAATGSALETAILLALFTDLAAAPDYTPLDGDRRGHWSNVYTVNPTGSDLWQLDHAKMTDANVALAKNSTVRALQPLIDAGVASAIDVQAQRQGALGQVCAISLVVTAPTGAVSIFRYAWAWSQV